MQREHNPFYPSRDPGAGLAEDQREFLDHARISLGHPVLFYASLRDPAVFEVVTGRSMEATRWEHVTVRGYSTCEVRAGTGFPGLFASDPDTELDCLLISDLTLLEKTMIAWYEWNEYDLREIPLADGRTAEAFLPDLDAIRRGYGAYEIVPWSFEAWRIYSLEDTIATAREWMSQRPEYPALAAAGFFRNASDRQRVSG